MADCDKYKRKFYIGIFLFLSWFVLIALKDIIVNDDNFMIFISYILISLIIGYKWIRKYMICLQDYNSRHKSPLDKNYSDKVMW